MQRLAQIRVAQLPQGPRDDLLILCTNTRHPHGQTLPPIHTLLLHLLLNLQHLLRALRHRHVARRLVDQTTSGHIFETLLLNLDIEEDEGVQSNARILGDAVVEGGGLPVIQEEDHGHGLPEVVELQARGADGGQDGGVGDGARGDGEFARAQDEVGVRRCSVAKSVTDILERGFLGW